MYDITERKNIFEETLLSIKRPGIRNLLDYLDSSGFYEAPASISSHLSCKGGLITHSSNVSTCLALKKKSLIFERLLINTSYETISIVSLLHDVGKLQYLNLRMQIPYDHGKTSSDIIERYIELTEEERLAITYHMGPYAGESQFKKFGEAARKYPLVLALFEADMEASKLLEFE